MAYGWIKKAFGSALVQHIVAIGVELLWTIAYAQAYLTHTSKCTVAYLPAYNANTPMQTVAITECLQPFIPMCLAFAY